MSVSVCGEIPTSNPDADPFTGNESYSPRDFPASGDPTYNIVADRASVREGEFVTYTITTKNVPSGTAIKYAPVKAKL
mgnify:CR=1 FL=1